MSTYDVPPIVILLLYDLTDLHRARHCYHSQHSKAYRNFVADQLCSTTHCADKRVFIVTTQTSQQNANHADGRYSNKEEYADVEVDDMSTFIPR